MKLKSRKLSVNGKLFVVWEDDLTYDELTVYAGINMPDEWKINHGHMKITLDELKKIGVTDENGIIYVTVTEVVEQEN